MLGMIARDYRAQLMGGGEDSSAAARGFWAVYCLLMLPMMLGYFESVRKAQIYMAAAIPFVWCLFGSGEYPVRLPKMMFLCPMDETMRRCYIRKAFWFRVIVHTALGVAGALLTCCLDNDLPGTLGLAANTFLLSVIAVGSGTFGTSRQAKEYDAQGMSGFGELLVRCFGAVIAVVLQVIYADAAASGGLLRQAQWELVLIGVMEALLLFFTAVYFACWRTMQEAAVHYEQAQQIRASGRKCGGRSSR